MHRTMTFDKVQALLLVLTNFLSYQTAVHINMLSTEDVSVGTIFTVSSEFILRESWKLLLILRAESAREAKTAGSSLANGLFRV